jgi:alkylation response protein AidB-like acyl-CoA dehydrogenase
VNPTHGPEAERFRRSIQAFLRIHLPAGWAGIGTLEGDEADRFVDSWRATLFEQGLLAPGWPKEFGGGGRSALEQVVIAEEFAKAGVPTGGVSDDLGIQMLGNTLLCWGSDEQRHFYLPRVLSGEHTWCQGYSEPNAGSDLAGLSLRATCVDGGWVLNGQKIWTSLGHRANHIFTLARTDISVPKHRGITFMLVDMRQAGIEVRPITTATGAQDFNEVFFTDAFCPDDAVVGGVGNGWAVAMGLLGFERGESAATRPVEFRCEFDRLLVLARANGRASEPTVRQRLARCYGEVEIMRFLGLRALTGFLAGREPGVDGAITKLYWSEYHRKVTNLAMDVLGADATTCDGRRPRTAFHPDDASAPNSTRSWVETWLHARAGTIYSGSSEIQRNIIGEMVLDLPKEPRP